MYGTLADWLIDYPHGVGSVDIKEWYEGRFQIIEYLGIGHTCVVFRALDTQLDREVALKVWHGWSSYSSDLLLREGQVLSRISHPQIVRIFDFGLGSRSMRTEPWLALEFLGRTTLRDILSAGIPARDRLRSCIAIGIRLAGIVQYLHDSAGLFQLDIKPDNIATDAGLLTLRLMDLGSSLDAGAAWQGRLGTPGYIAPEILEKDSQATKESDLFSLGMVLYELLTAHNELLGVQETLRAFPRRGERFGATVSLSMSPEAPECLRVLRVMQDLSLSALLSQVNAPSEVISLILGLCSYSPKERPTPEQVRTVLGSHSKDESPIRLKIFISYARSDKERFVTRLAEELQRRGFYIWLDELSLLTGEPIWERIAKAIDESDFVLLVLSANSIASHGVREELRMAHLGNLEAVKLLPIRIDPIKFEELPAYLRSRHVIDFVGWEDARKLEERVSRLSSDLIALSEAARNPGAPAHGWRRR